MEPRKKAHSKRVVKEVQELKRRMVAHQLSVPTFDSLAHHRAESTPMGMWVVSRRSNAGKILGLFLVCIVLAVEYRGLHDDFHQLHDPCGSHIKQQRFCPAGLEEELIYPRFERTSMTRGYE